MHPRFHSLRLTASTRRSLETLAFGLVGALVFSTAALARDSIWLHGDNGHLAVNTLEHRAGDDRATDIALLYGSHVLQGTLSGADSGQITLKEAGGDENSYVFSGTISVSYDKSQITLKGKLAVNDAEHTEISTYNTTIKCKEMSADQ